MKNTDKHSGEFAQLIDALSKSHKHSFELAALNDFLYELSSENFAKAVSSPPQGLTAFLSNYVTAMVEHAAFLKEVLPPDWTNEIEPLREAYFASDLLGLRSHLLISSPTAFRKRNIFVNATVGDRV